ncbi:hypothetical protein BDW62DRAFT_205167 [Aspergillus aurantiobrunneus]
MHALMLQRGIHISEACHNLVATKADVSNSIHWRWAQFRCPKQYEIASGVPDTAPAGRRKPQGPVDDGMLQLLVGRIQQENHASWWHTTGKLTHEVSWAVGMAGLLSRYKGICFSSTFCCSGSSLSPYLNTNPEYPATHCNMMLPFGLGLGLFVLSALPTAFSLSPDDSDNPHCSQKKDGGKGSACYVKCKNGVPDTSSDVMTADDPWCYIKGGDSCFTTPTCTNIDPKECDGECHGSPG